MAYSMLGFYSFCYLVFLFILVWFYWKVLVFLKSIGILLYTFLFSFSDTSNSHVPDLRISASFPFMSDITCLPYDTYLGFELWLPEHK